MKLLSFNCRGLASPSKHLSLQRLLELAQPDIVMLQETLGAEALIVPLLERLLKGWSFFGLDASGCVGGLEMGWNQKSIKLESSWGFPSGQGMFVYVAELGKYFTILNIYGPTQDRPQFWNSLLEKSFLKDCFLILGGDLNFSIGAGRILGEESPS
jgi:exonuclease III